MQRTLLLRSIRTAGSLCIHLAEKWLEISDLLSAGNREAMGCVLGRNQFATAR